MREGQRRLSNALSDCNSPSDAVREIGGPVIDSLITAYFDIIHSDFPVLHKASFREVYEIWSASDATSAANPVWFVDYYVYLSCLVGSHRLLFPKRQSRSGGDMFRSYCRQFSLLRMCSRSRLSCLRRFTFITKITETLAGTSLEQLSESHLPLYSTAMM